MTKEESKNILSEFLSSLTNEKPDNVLRLYFVKKSSLVKYQAFEPEVSNAVQKKILDTVLPYVVKQLQRVSVVDYNPIGCADEEAEMLGMDKVADIGAFIESVSGDRLNKEMAKLNIAQISFYCLHISYQGKEIYLFRQFSKMKKLRSGFVAHFFNNELVAMDSDFLGIDEAIDMIYTDSQLFVLNHISLERIFNYRDEYLRKTNEAMGEILNQGVISNMEQFNDDCVRDVRIMKRFTSIMSNERLPLFFENYDKVPGIVKELGLDIEFDEDGKMVYKEKSQLFHIINLMSDSYFRTLLSERTGLAKIEEEITQS